MDGPKLPNVVVKLDGEDGNAFSVIGKVTAAMRLERVDPSVVKAFQDEAMASDYDNLLQTVTKWVTVE